MKRSIVDEAFQGNCQTRQIITVLQWLGTHSALCGFQVDDFKKCCGCEVVEYLSVWSMAGWRQNNENAIELTVLTEIQLSFSNKHFLNRYKPFVNFHNPERVDFDNFCLFLHCFYGGADFQRLLLCCFSSLSTFSKHQKSFHFILFKTKCSQIYKPFAYFHKLNTPMCRLHG